MTTATAAQAGGDPYDWLPEDQRQPQGGDTGQANDAQGSADRSQLWPEGPYKGIFFKAEHATGFSKGTPGYALHFVIGQGTPSQREVIVSVWLTDGNDVALKQLDAIGWNGEYFEFAFTGLNAEHALYMKHEFYEKKKIWQEKFQISGARPQVRRDDPNLQKISARFKQMKSPPPPPPAGRPPTPPAPPQGAPGQPAAHVMRPPPPQGYTPPPGQPAAPGYAPASQAAPAGYTPPVATPPQSVPQTHAPAPYAPAPAPTPAPAGMNPPPPQAPAPPPPPPAPAPVGALTDPRRRATNSGEAWKVWTDAGCADTNAFWAQVNATCGHTDQTRITPEQWQQIANGAPPF